MTEIYSISAYWKQCIISDYSFLISTVTYICTYIYIISVVQRNEKQYNHTFQNVYSDVNSIIRYIEINEKAKYLSSLRMCMCIYVIIFSLCTFFFYSTDNNDNIIYWILVIIIILILANIIYRRFPHPLLDVYILVYNVKMWSYSNVNDMFFFIYI